MNARIDYHSDDAPARVHIILLGLLAIGCWAGWAWTYNRLVETSDKLEDTAYELFQYRCKDPQIHIPCVQH